MLKAISLTCLVLLSGALGCVADVAPSETGDYGPTPAEQTAEGQSFKVQLPRDVTMESVVPAIVAAGICPHGTTEKIRTDCNDVGSWGGLGIGLLCALTVIIPF